MKAKIRSALAGLQRPVDFFSGLTLRAAPLAPDNILLFQRRDTDAFRPEGVSDNFHHRFELFMVLENGGPVRIGETSYHLLPGEGALIFPNQFHHYMDVAPGPLHWLFITFELSGEAPLAAPESLRNSPRQLFPQGEERLETLLHAYTAARPDPLAVSWHLAEFLREMTLAPAIAPERSDIHATDQARDLLLEKINAHIRSHLRETVTIGTLARAVGYSESHVRSVFRNRLGVSLGRYLRESRLSEAAKLLASPASRGGNMATLAAQVGFSSAFSFSRAFKNAYGVSPRSYAKHLHPTHP